MFKRKQAVNTYKAPLTPEEKLIEAVKKSEYYEGLIHGILIGVITVLAVFWTIIYIIPE
jgi:hypothetical protein